MKFLDQFTVYCFREWSWKRWSFSVKLEAPPSSHTPGWTRIDQDFRPIYSALFQGVELEKVKFFCGALGSPQPTYFTPGYRQGWTKFLGQFTVYCFREWSWRMWRDSPIYSVLFQGVKLENVDRQPNLQCIVSGS
jgi:hypothetical protein